MKIARMKGIIPQGRALHPAPTAPSAAELRGMNPCFDCARSVMPEQARSRHSLRLSIKFFSAIFLLIFGNTFLFSQITLDKAISEAAKELDTRLVPGTVVAMVNFNSETEKMASYVIDEIHKNLVKSNLVRVVERKQIDLVIKELNFQMSGYVSDESFQGIGHMLGAESIISGSIEKLDKVYRFRIQAMSVKTAQVQASYSANVENDDTVAALTGGKAETSGLSDYTSTERDRAFGLNLIPFCSLGSWFMGDYFGAILGMSLQIVGFGMAGVGAFWTVPVDRNAYPNEDEYQTAKDNADLTTGGVVCLSIGLGALLGGYIFSLVRPYHVHKEAPSTAQASNASIENIGIAFVPVKKGTGVQLSYKMKF